MTDNELKELVASLAISQTETVQQFKETRELLDKIARENKRENKELRQQIGGLGNKFGSFTEGMAFPSNDQNSTKKIWYGIYWNKSYAF
ncbi:hypothetical protein QUF74_14865 [Candidatus Halobeggiatoa sp. HSG11]|nr:hypothetical protein [Candidatus Halobeggiatoa sp. HSG11]